MTITIHANMVQGTDEWLKARAGIITASTIGSLITPTLKIANNETSRNLLNQLAAERITGQLDPSFANADMQRGHDEEPRARNHYAQTTGREVTEVGFITRQQNGYTIGYSPDGLVGTNGLIEIKAPRQKKQLVTFISDEVPAEHIAQIQTGLWVSGSAWCDFISWYGGMPAFVKRVHPDPDWFAVIEQVATEAEQRIQTIIDTYTTRTDGLPPTEPAPTIADLTF